VEVEGAADTHEFRSITEQGTLSADPTDFFRTANLAQSNALTQSLGSVLYADPKFTHTDMQYPL